MNFEKKIAIIKKGFFLSFLKPRILFVEPQDDIDKITSEIQVAKTDEIALVIPIKAIVLQSIISVKILRSNAEKAGKKISIVTRDKQGQKFSQQLGIPTAADLEHLEESPIEKVIRKKNVSKKNTRRIQSRSFSPQKRKKEESVDLQKKKQEILELLSRPSKTLVFSICAVSVSLLLFITTLALPGATIRISPQKKVISTTINVTLTTGTMENATDSWRQYTLAAIPIESIFEKTIPFETVTKIFTGKNASGTVTLVNKLDEEMSLRPGTRFQTDNGIVFRSKDWIKVIPHTQSEVALEADEFDIFGDTIGARGNIDTEQRMFLPGLDEKFREYIWAEVHNPFSGGVSGHRPEVSETDLDIAKKQIQEMILRDARKDSEAFVERKNKLENRDLILLPGNEFIDTEILEIDIPDDIIGKHIDSFSVRSRMRVKMLSFSRKEMFSILRGALLKSVDPGMELITLEESSMYPEVLHVSPNKDKVKVTISTRGVEAYIIEPRTKNGVQFVNKVKEGVLGKTTDQAQKILENYREVALVEISLWPPIFRRIPRLPENISVKLLE